MASPARISSARIPNVVHSVRLAAGEMVRSMAEARDLVLRGGIDVIQADVSLSGGITGCRRLAGLADLMTEDARDQLGIF